MKQKIVTPSPHAYVERTRARTTIPGSEPSFAAGPSQTAFLILHGWSASAESVRFLAAGLAAAGHSALAPTLPGHGTVSRDMLAAGPVEWNEAAREAAETLRARFETVVVLGVSMGGALAIQLAGGSPDLVDGVVTVNAPIFMDNASFAREILSPEPLAPMLAWERPTFFGEEVEEISYAHRFKKSGADLYAMCSLARDMLPLVTCPMLVVQSVLDTVVPKASADEILAKAVAADASVLWLDQSYHVSQLDLDRSRIVEAVLAFEAQCTPSRMASRRA